MPTALVVDDDPDIRDVIDYVLDQAGFEVFSAPDGEAGLAAVLGIRPDIVLLDWMMPRLSGLEVCRAVRSDPDLTSIAVVLLTAKTQEADIALGFEAGAHDYILKPFSPRLLVGRVREVLAQIDDAPPPALL